jgi:hypothetical protein
MIPAISDRRTVSRIADTTLFSICWSCRMGALRIPDNVLGTTDVILKGKPRQSRVELFSHPKQTLPSPMDIFCGIAVLRPDCTAAAAPVSTACRAELTTVWAAWISDAAPSTAVAIIGGTSPDEASGIESNSSCRS